MDLYTHRLVFPWPSKASFCLIYPPGGLRFLLSPLGGVSVSSFVHQGVSISLHSSTRGRQSELILVQQDVTASFDWLIAFQAESPCYLKRYQEMKITRYNGCVYEK